ncbi:MAG: AraC family transcriptional regulator [Bacteroidales bacterium]|nr:AraC family transcriptional regulator [Bacteroidales bacterium]
MFEDIILTLPFFVTFFWAITLWIGAKKKELPKKILALFMTASALLYASHAVYFAKGYQLNIIVDPIYALCNLSVFPLYYIYIKSLTQEKSISRASLLVFLPAIVLSLSSAILFVAMSNHEVNNFIHGYLYKEVPITTYSTLLKLQIAIHYIERVTFALLLVPCTYFSWKHIFEYEKKIREFYSTTENRSLNWTVNLLIATIITAVFAFILNTVGKSFFVDDFSLLIIPSLFFSALLYTIGYLGTAQAFSIEDYKKDLLGDKFVKNISNYNVVKYKLQAQITRLLEEDQIFRNCDLRITDISRTLNTNRTYISNIINTDFNCSFCDLINHYRVNYSKQLLLHQNAYILEYVSNESGFASVNSFLRAFKKETGITPGQFRKQLQNSK